MSFVHLHLHTQYSFLDGAIRMSELCPRIADLGMEACAVTDHGNLFGSIDFYRRAKKQGIKPILGVEAYVAETSRLDRVKGRNSHLVLLAKNAEGYRNLMYLVSMGYREGFYYKPRIDKELLRGHAEGLIGLSACLSGELASSCLRGDLDAAKRAAEEYRQIFAPDHYYIEIQENGLDEQQIVNQHLKQIARDEKIPLIATNDCHYKMRADAVAHDVLTAIQFGMSRNDPNRRRLGSDAFYIRSPEEMATLFRDCPEAIDNTVRVAEMVDLELELGKPVLPTFVPEDGSDLESHLIDRANKGLEERFRELPYEVDQEEYRARLEEELGIIIGMKFPGYFLIVADFINWAKLNDISVGPGRGSGAGSLVAFSLRITDLDPLPYNLLFERFLNPERISMPDFDVDFCQERRGEVIDYVTEKYGAHQVGQIATFAQLKAKSVLKDVARCLELPFTEVNALTKLLPNTYKTKKGNVKPITIAKALELEPKLRQLQSESDTYREVIEIAQTLEGLYRQAGMHAAGIVISDTPLWETVPVFRGNDDEIVTQFSMSDVEDAGLVKFDFLGLKTLDVIYAAERHINERLEREIAAKDIEQLLYHPHVRSLVQGSGARNERSVPSDRSSDRSLADAEKLQAALDAGNVALDDKELNLRLSCARLPLRNENVYRLIGKGETLGVFQLESTGFQELLKKLRPDCFEDVVAAVALYRPGPLGSGMVDDFIDCKHGKKSVKYPHDSLEEVLKPTYGGFVYQEQVMQAAQIMAGYSLGGADLLRRAMGKKKHDVMAKERVRFSEGCVDRGISAEKAKEVFDLMESFASYGFNKSHSAAYALVTYHTAYLKTYYPVEFMAALLSTEVNNTENIVKYIGEARSMSIEVLPPAVNESEISFTVEAKRAATEGSGDGWAGSARPGPKVLEQAKRAATEGSGDGWAGSARPGPKVVEGKIRFGLGAIKGLGDAALEALLTARKKAGAFNSIYDFCEQVPLKQLNKKTLEVLVRSGAFDCFGQPRARQLEAIERAIEAAKSTQHAKAVGQGSLFDSPELAQAVKPREIYDESIREWPELTRLKLEKEAIGFYVTGHPLARYQDDLKRLGSTTVAQMEKLGRADVRVGCVVSAIRERPLRDGSGRMAFITIEDLTGVVEMLVPAKVFAEHEMTFKADLPLLIKTFVSSDRDEDGNQRLRVRCSEAVSLGDARRDRTRAVILTLEEEAIATHGLGELKKILGAFEGSCPVRVVVRVPKMADVEMELSVHTDPCDGLVDQIEQVYGQDVVHFA